MSLWGVLVNRKILQATKEGAIQPHDLSVSGFGVGWVFLILNQWMMLLQTAMSWAWHLFSYNFCKCFGKCLHACFYSQSISEVLPCRVLYSSVSSLLLLLLLLLSPPFSMHRRVPLVFHFASPSHYELVLSPTPNQPWNPENSEVLLCACFLQWLSSCLFGCQLSRAHTSSYSGFLSDFCIDLSCP